MMMAFDSVPGDILKILSEMSWDTLLLLVGLAFVAVAILGNISGKISPGKGGRIAAGIVGAGLFAGGFYYHYVTHSPRVTAVEIVPPQSAEGACPQNIALQGVVDVSGAGSVIAYFEFSNGNASASQVTPFQQSNSLIVPGVWEVHETQKGAWVRLQVVAPEKKASGRSKAFTITCVSPEPAGPLTRGRAQPSMQPASPPPPPVPSQPLKHALDTSSNSVALDSVEPSGPYLKRGQPITFNMQVSYNLVSADSAILSISAAQFSNSPMGCGGGGELTDPVQLPISRGQHEAKVSLTWSGDTGASTKGRVFGSGYLSFVLMFWTNSNGSRGERINSFGIYKEYCYQFGP